jgi:hypothetical protein
VNSTRAIGALESALTAGGIALATLLEGLELETMTLDEVRGFGDPGVLFRYVNRREELAEAAGMLAPRKRC